MKTIVRSPGSATIINAIATGFGSAFGIDLDIKCIAKTTDKGITCLNDVGADIGFMELCVQRVFNHYNIDTSEFGIDLKTESNLPMASGLSSSSASSNAIVKAVSSVISEEFNLKPLDDLELINMAIDASLEAGVTITGSFDDATASYFGGVVVTNNKNREFIIREKMEEYPVLVYMPNYYSKSGDSNSDRMKLLAPLVETAFEFACNKDYFKALNLNGLLYSAALGFNSSIAIDALESGAIASGLSGTGSSFVAVSNEDTIDDIIYSWEKYEGTVIETKIDNVGCKIL
ncbi:shikimate kinase [Methanobrevibacter gottschalkii]|uniref:Shikimate kinase n=2 Tax=Methanobrevibacter gottschalkii TaxID=190974 RepID=A0A3N5B7U1_9EURY|nr:MULTISPECIES: shikimate kinase [Methanobrevibacter]MCQ2970984.1 shikimate kinase [archaeon]OEC96831.1 shikimate kinase [Methanobrevibacter sp. A27]RPF51550.1 shikimate kinase [Methanobrevibacter gottschalkii DSM 11977]SEK71841.1 shikimate kinase [Methanobrevibacter gottschalkii]